MSTKWYSINHIFNFDYGGFVQDNLDSGAESPMYL